MITASKAKLEPGRLLIDGQWTDAAGDFMTCSVCHGTGSVVTDGSLDPHRIAVLVDALGPWVAASPGMTVDAAALCAALTGRAADTVVVSEEVGLGVHPATEDGRRFRDALGTLNQAVATVADEVLFVVAGRILPLGPPGVR